MSPPATKNGNWTEKVLYSFQDGADGATPVAGLVMDAAGNLYGTTSAANFAGSGTVFELSPPATTGGTWTEAVLHTFQGTDGAFPKGTLIFDHSGNLYGTTAGGGSYVGQECTGGGCGTVFELTPTTSGAWTEIVLYAFTASHDGNYPDGGLVMDMAGNLYGTTYAGGVLTSPNPCTSSLGGCGTIFQLHPSAGAWTEHILHRFDWTDGDRSVSSLAFYKGVLYGTTSEAQNYGSVFQLALSSGKWTLTSLFTFNENDGSFPLSGVTVDTSGNLFGVTNGGPAQGLYGNAYELTPPTTPGGAWTETVLHNFTSGKDSSGPVGGVALRGNIIYGTTSACVDSQCTGGYGTVFAVTK